MEPNEVHNELHTDHVHGQVVQAGNIHGDVHLHARRPTSLDLAANDLSMAVRGWPMWCAG